MSSKTCFYCQQKFLRQAKGHVRYRVRNCASPTSLAEVFPSAQYEQSSTNRPPASAYMCHDCLQKIDTHNAKKKPKNTKGKRSDQQLLSTPGSLSHTTGKYLTVKLKRLQLPIPSNARTVDASVNSVTCERNATVSPSSFLRSEPDCRVNLQGTCMLQVKTLYMPQISRPGTSSREPYTTSNDGGNRHGNSVVDTQNSNTDMIVCDSSQQHRPHINPRDSSTKSTHVKKKRKIGPTPDSNPPTQQQQKQLDIQPLVIAPTSGDDRVHTTHDLNIHSQQELQLEQLQVHHGQPITQPLIHRQQEAQLKQMQLQQHITQPVAQTVQLQQQNPNLSIEARDLSIVASISGSEQPSCKLNTQQHKQKRYQQKQGHSVDVLQPVDVPILITADSHSHQHLHNQHAQPPDTQPLSVPITISPSSTSHAQQPLSYMTTGQVSLAGISYSMPASITPSISYGSSQFVCAPNMEYQHNSDSATSIPIIIAPCVSRDSQEQYQEEITSADTQSTANQIIVTPNGNNDFEEPFVNHSMLLEQESLNTPGLPSTSSNMLQTSGHSAIASNIGESKEAPKKHKTRKRKRNGQKTSAIISDLPTSRPIVIFPRGSNRNFSSAVTLPFQQPFQNENLEQQLSEEQNSVPIIITPSSDESQQLPHNQNTNQQQIQYQDTSTGVSSTSTPIVIAPNSNQDVQQTTLQAQQELLDIPTYSVPSTTLSPIVIAPTLSNVEQTRSAVIHHVKRVNYIICHKKQQVQCKSKVTQSTAASLIMSSSGNTLNVTSPATTAVSLVSSPSVNNSKTTQSTAAPIVITPRPISTISQLLMQRYQQDRQKKVQQEKESKQQQNSLPAVPKSVASSSLLSVRYLIEHNRVRQQQQVSTSGISTAASSSSDNSNSRQVHAAQNTQQQQQMEQLRKGNSHSADTNKEKMVIRYKKTNKKTKNISNTIKQPVDTAIVPSKNSHTDELQEKDQHHSQQGQPTGSQATSITDQGNLDQLTNNFNKDHQEQQKECAFINVHPAEESSVPIIISTFSLASVQQQLEHRQQQQPYQSEQQQVQEQHQSIDLQIASVHSLHDNDSEQFLANGDLLKQKQHNQQQSQTQEKDQLESVLQCTGQKATHALFDNSSPDQEQFGQHEKQPHQHQVQQSQRLEQVPKVLKDSHIMEKMRQIKQYSDTAVMQLQQLQQPSTHLGETAKPTVISDSDNSDLEQPPATGSKITQQQNNTSIDAQQSQDCVVNSDITKGVSGQPFSSETELQLQRLESVNDNCADEALQETTIVSDNNASHQYPTNKDLQQQCASNKQPSEQPVNTGSQNEDTEVLTNSYFTKGFQAIDPLVISDSDISDAEQPSKNKNVQQLQCKPYNNDSVQASNHGKVQEGGEPQLQNEGSRHSSPQYFAVNLDSDEELTSDNISAVQLQPDVQPPHGGNLLEKEVAQFQQEGQQSLTDKETAQQSIILGSSEWPPSTEQPQKDDFIINVRTVPISVTCNDYSEQPFTNERISANASPTFQQKEQQQLQEKELHWSPAGLQGAELAAFSSDSDGNDAELPAISAIIHQLDQDHSSADVESEANTISVNDSSIHPIAEGLGISDNEKSKQPASDANMQRNEKQYDPSANTLMAQLLCTVISDSDSDTGDDTNQENIGQEEKSPMNMQSEALNISDTDENSKQTAYQDDNIQQKENQGAQFSTVISDDDDNDADLDQDLDQLQQDKSSMDMQSEYTTVSNSDDDSSVNKKSPQMPTVISDNNNSMPGRDSCDDTDNTKEPASSENLKQQEKWAHSLADTVQFSTLIFDVDYNDGEEEQDNDSSIDKQTSKMSTATSKSNASDIDQLSSNRNNDQIQDTSTKDVHSKTTTISTNENSKALSFDENAKQQKLQSSQESAVLLNQHKNNSNLYSSKIIRVNEKETVSTIRYPDGTTVMYVNEGHKRKIQQQTCSADNAVSNRGNSEAEPSSTNKQVQQLQQDNTSRVEQLDVVSNDEKNDSRTNKYPDGSKGQHQQKNHSTDSQLATKPYVISDIDSSDSEQPVSKESREYLNKQPLHTTGTDVQLMQEPTLNSDSVADEQNSQRQTCHLSDSESVLKENAGAHTESLLELTVENIASDNENQLAQEATVILSSNDNDARTPVVISDSDSSDIELIVPAKTSHSSNKLIRPKKKQLHKISSKQSFPIIFYPDGTFHRTRPLPTKDNVQKPGPSSIDSSSPSVPIVLSPDEDSEGQENANGSKKKNKTVQKPMHSSSKTSTSNEPSASYSKAPGSSTSSIFMKQGEKTDPGPSSNVVSPFGSQELEQAIPNELIKKKTNLQREETTAVAMVIDSNSSDESQEPVIVATTQTLNVMQKLPAPESKQHIHEIPVFLQGKSRDVLHELLPSSFHLLKNGFFIDLKQSGKRHYIAAVSVDLCIAQLKCASPVIWITLSTEATATFVKAFSWTYISIAKKGKDDSGSGTITLLPRNLNLYDSTLLTSSFTMLNLEAAKEKFLIVESLEAAKLLQQKFKVSTTSTSVVTTVLQKAKCIPCLTPTGDSYYKIPIYLQLLPASTTLAEHSVAAATLRILDHGIAIDYRGAVRLIGAKDIYICRAHLAKPYPCLIFSLAPVAVKSIRAAMPRVRCYKTTAGATEGSERNMACITVLPQDLCPGDIVAIRKHFNNMTKLADHKILFEINAEVARELAAQSKTAILSDEQLKGIDDLQFTDKK